MSRKPLNMEILVCTAMNKKLSLVFTITILLTVTVVTSVELSQSAEGMQSKGTFIPKYGAATKSKVCGDRLCSETSLEQKNSQMTQTKSNQIRNQTMTQQYPTMPQITESMSKSEILNSMLSMMSDHRNMMIQMMGKMTKQELLDHAKMMKEQLSQMGTKGMSMSNKQMDIPKMQGKKTPLYNEMLNPSQIEYPNIVGFNDLHIEAIRHLDPHGDDSKLGVIVHHHCKVYDDMTAACLLFPTGMSDQDKPYGIEYIITSEQFKELPEDEKQYWHYHLTELPRAKANLPDLTANQLAPLQPVLNETYGKVYYFWNIDDKFPIGEPTVLVIQNLPE